MTNQKELNWKGLTLTIFYNAEDGEIVSVTNQDNDNFLELLTDFNVFELQDHFEWWMSENKE